MLELYRLYPDDTLELIIDRMEKPEKAIAKGVEYAAAHTSDDVSERMSWVPLKGQDSFRNVLPIQAADFAAWEARKEHEIKNDWWRNYKRGLPSAEWISSVTAWLTVREKVWPGQRKSFEGLTKATKMHASVLDYDALCRIHEVRHGVWTVEARDRYRRELVFGKSS